MNPTPSPNCRCNASTLQPFNPCSHTPALRSSGCCASIRPSRPGEYPNAASLARDLEVSSKSIHRDLEFMRDRLGLPIEYDTSRFGYWYTEEVENFPTVQFTEGELFALVVAEKALQQYRGTSFEQPLLSALRKMAQSLPDTISLSLNDIDQTISFRTRAEPIQDLATFDALAKATAARQQLRLSYRKPGQRQPEQRVVDPYHLANINGEWFLFAFDHLRKDIRTFVPARIKAIERTGETFQRRHGFSLEKRLRGSFGVQSGHGAFEVVIRFDQAGRRLRPREEMAQLATPPRPEGRRRGAQHEPFKPSGS